MKQKLELMNVTLKNSTLIVGNNVVLGGQPVDSTDHDTLPDRRRANLTAIHGMKSLLYRAALNGLLVVDIDNLPEGMEFDAAMEVQDMLDTLAGEGEARRAKRMKQKKKVG